MKLSEDDEPWYKEKFKQLNRKHKREYFINQKSDKWRSLNLAYLREIKKAKEDYRQRVLDNIKYSNPRKWYSKMKRMSGQTGNQQIYF